MSDLRVLQYCPIPNLAGASRSMLTLIRELAKTQPTFAVVFFDDELAQAAREAGAEVRTIYGQPPRPKSRLKRLTRAIGCIAKAIRDWRIDIVHVQTAFGNRHAWPAKMLTGAKLLTHQRDNYQRDNYHKLLGRADRIIAISNWVKQGLPPRLKARTDVIYNAVELPPIDGTTHRATDAQIVIGVAGRCLPEKGFDIFLDAVALADLPQDATVLMWGVPPPKACHEYGRQLWRQIQQMPRSLRERIRVEPFRVDVHEFYRSVDIVVVPSRFAEPFGRVAIEAMAWCRPVVVACHGGLTEIVTHNETGLVFRPADAADLAEKLQTLLGDDDLRSRLINAGRNEVEKRFTADVHARAVTAVYESLS